MMSKIGRIRLWLIAISVVPVAVIADGGLLATSGANPIEGGSGGGLTPWATLTGYATRSEIGGSVFLTHLDSDDFSFSTGGAAVNFYNRLELSAARQSLDISELNTPVNDLEQTVIGAKLKLGGDLIFGRMPQTALGVQYKRHHQGDFVRALGAEDDSTVDVYISSTRLFLDGLLGRSILANATLRSTEANQTGLLGYGSQSDSSRDLVLEGTVGIFLTRELMISYEYRQKPDNLAFAGEDDWQDVFISYFPNKSIAVIAAWVDLGSIAGQDDQNAWYLSVQGTF